MLHTLKRLNHYLNKIDQRKAELYNLFSYKFYTDDNWAHDLSRDEELDRYYRYADYWAGRFQKTVDKK